MWVRDYTILTNKRIFMFASKHKYTFCVMRFEFCVLRYESGEHINFLAYLLYVLLDELDLSFQILQH